MYKRQGASIGFGFAVADAVTSSTSASDFGGSALASTASGAAFGGAYGYSVAGTRNNTATRSSKLDRYVKNPQKLQNVSPAKIEKIAMKENLQIGTLSKGAHAGQGMKVTWGGDKLLQFHPGGGHPVSYTHLDVYKRQR